MTTQEPQKDRKAERNPRPIKVTNGDDGWMYFNQSSIDICIWQRGSGTLTARLTKKQLQKIIEHYAN